MRRAKRIAIVGAGCSGVLTAAQILRHPSRVEQTVVLIDRRAAMGSGTAFGTRRPCHLLNVTAERMSAFPDDPSHFLRWAQARDVSVGAETFVARSLYGDYLRAVLRSAEADAPPAARLATITGMATAVGNVPDGSGHAVVFADGSVVETDTVVLALGNVRSPDPPGTAALRAGARYTSDPWAVGALDSVPMDDPVLLIGTGLTAIDVLLAMHARGHRGVVHAMSRHGLLPTAHRRAITTPEVPVELDAVLAEQTARGLVREMRREVRRRAALDGDWRDVVDAIRPHSDRVWQNLARDEQRRFVCHLARYWDVHRHRMAPDVARSVDGLHRTNRFSVVRGTLVGADEHDEGVVVSVRASSGVVVLSVGHIVNCTGPRSDVVNAGDPVIDSLVAAGRARSGPLGLGLDTDDRGALIDARGCSDRAFWTIGSLRRGGLWETTAVPEIRAQASELAASILA